LAAGVFQDPPASLLAVIGFDRSESKPVDR
jgi:hypothetical protein